MHSFCATLYYPPIYACVFQVFSFPQISAPKPCTRLSLHIRATCPAHLTLLDFIIATILGEVYRSLRNMLNNFLKFVSWVCMGLNRISVRVQGKDCDSFSLSCKGPFRGLYCCNRVYTLKMAPVMCRNMSQTY